MGINFHKNKLIYLRLAMLHLAMLIVFANTLHAQTPTPTPVKKSNKIETIDGTKYYIHLVEKGQTLYSISRTYSTTVDKVLFYNQEATDGIKPGDELKIPTISAIPVTPAATATKKEDETKPVTAKVTTTAPPTVDPELQKAITNLSTDQVPVTHKDTSINNIPGSEVHVALFLPLNLISTDNINVEKIAHGDDKFAEDTKIGIEFYEGIKLAFDSLRKLDFALFLHIYDTDVDSLAFIKLLNKSELTEMDLIIGPLYGSKFDLVLKFAKYNNINILSPTLLGNNMLLGNPNVSKVKPSYMTQADVLAKFVTENYAGQNIIVFNSANVRDKPYLNIFKKTANPILIKSKKDTVKEVTFTSLKNFISKTKPNIVVVPSTDRSFVTEAVNKLYSHKQDTKDSVIVLGFNNFQEIESLDFGYLDFLHAIISSYTDIDYQHSETKSFILKYRNEFHTEPSQYAISGYDIGLYYFSALYKYGSAFQNKLPELKAKGIQTEFDFYQTTDGSGYENKGVGIFKFENYSYKRIK